MARKREVSRRDPAPVTLPLAPGANLFRMLVDNVRGYAIILLDAEGNVRSWNTGAERIKGYRASDVIGRNFSIFFTPDDVARGWPRRELEIAMAEGQVEDEGWRVRKNGTRFWANVVTTALRGHDGRLYGFSKITRDLSERRQEQDALRRSRKRARQLLEQANRDPLTGAFNRRHLVSCLRNALERADPVSDALLMIDVDRFKTVNDRFGHDTGDVVLTTIGTVARKLSRARDQLFRIGGDEFLLYLPDIAAEKAAQVAERLRAAVEACDAVPGGHVTVSIGVTELRPQDSVHTLMNRADAALYRAKQTGRNRVVVDLTEGQLGT